MKTTLKPMKRIIRTGISFTSEIHGRVRHCTVATFADGTIDLVALCDIVTRDGQKFLNRKSR